MAVYQQQGRYCARINYKRQAVFLGMYETRKEAEAVEAKALAQREAGVFKHPHRGRGNAEDRKRNGFLPYMRRHSGGKIHVAIVVKGETHSFGLFKSKRAAQKVARGIAQAVEAGTLTAFIAEFAIRKCKRKLPKYVYSRGKKYSAMLQIKKKMVYLGVFDTSEDASEAAMAVKKNQLIRYRRPRKPWAEVQCPHCKRVVGAESMCIDKLRDQSGVWHDMRCPGCSGAFRVVCKVHYTLEASKSNINVPK